MLRIVPIRRLGGIRWPAAAVTFGALARAGFRRHSTYRQATIAGAVTNTVFGFLRTYLLLAVVAAAPLAGGYTEDQLVTQVWLAQGILVVTGVWGWTELADRIRSGDIVTDLQRPVHPVTAYLAADLGRAGYATGTRFVLPVAAGAVAFGLRLPERPITWVLFVLSVLLAVVISFACRYLVNCAAYRLLDVRGVLSVWSWVSATGTGLFFPIRFLPEPVAWTLWLATPLPSIAQTPLDIAVERVSPAGAAGLLAVQAAWAAALLGLCALVQHRADRRLVVQGG